MGHWRIRHVNFSIPWIGRTSRKLPRSFCDLRSFTLDGLLPSEEAELYRFRFLGEGISSFFTPLTDTASSLKQQISLAKYAHLVCARWIWHGSAFMTGALYVDPQTIVENIVFSLAKQQIMDATQNFYIILDETDLSEQVFDGART